MSAGVDLDAGVGASAAVDRVDVRWISATRLRIATTHGAALGGDCVAWLSRRPEVLELQPGKRPHAATVHYHEECSARGALRRSLCDRMAARSPGSSPPICVEIAHALPGRVRFRTHGVDPADLERLAAWVAAQPGVTSASASPATGSLLAELDASRTDPAGLQHAIAASQPADWLPARPRPERPELGPTAYTTALLVVAASHLVPAPILTIGIAAATIPCARRAYAAITERRLGVDFLDLAAIVLSTATGLYTTAAFITWLLSIGDLVLAHTADQTRAAISEVLALDAEEAWRICGTTTERVPVAALRVGDRIVIEAGARIAADGTVRGGIAMVDEKALTGESIPSEKQAGARVLAATVVVEGQLIVEVERTGANTTAARIVRILEGTGAKPMSLQREVERRADWLVLPTIGVALSAALLSGQIGRMTSVLITDFGTGVRIAIPTAVLATMALAAREGVLVKGGHYLERLARADTVVFDKTGTLTAGAPRVVRIASLGRLSELEIVTLAAAAEARQKHPVAEAIRRCAAERQTPAVEADLGSEVYTIGVGLSARVDGKTVLVGGTRMMANNAIDVPRHHPAVASAPGTSSLFVAVNGRLEGVLDYADELRSESAAVVLALRAGGRREIVLLSGDAPATVEAVARALGIDRAVGGLLPEEKEQIVRELQAAGRTVAMVGDGINDAPALALAEVGISLDGATDVALEVADVILLSGGLSSLPRAFTFADQAMARVRRGVTLVIAPNVAAMVLGAAGLLSPGLAATINNGSTVIAAMAGVLPLLRARKRRVDPPKKR